MTSEQIATLNYILGTIEGIACACGDGNMQSGLLNAAETLSALLEELSKK